MPERDNGGPTPVGQAIGTTVSTTIKGARVAARGGGRFGRWVTRHVLFFRRTSGGNDAGMIRLLDLHAASCVGDTLVTIGLASTVFFSVPTGEARGRVALYLLITMVPFAVLAPVVGPLLDRFRHGRRYALAVTMLGRAVLAWVISDNLHSIVLYPAAFGVLALSRAYGVARSAAVPRLLPAHLGLSEAGARASIFGTFAGLAAAPVGAIALWFGPTWPPRVAAVAFIVGTAVALTLPGRADSDPPKRLPRIFGGGQGVRVLSGPLIVAGLINSAMLRGAFGFLALFTAFAIRSHEMPTVMLGIDFHGATALAIVAGTLGIGSIVATAVGSRLKIRRPLLLQSGGLVVVSLVGVLCVLDFKLFTLTLLALSIAVASGLAKLALDATIQERVPEDTRASAFAHSETGLMLAWVAGGAIGLIPFGGRTGIIVGTVAIIAVTVTACGRAYALREDRLSGAAHTVKVSPEQVARRKTIELTAGPAPVDTRAATQAEPTSRWGRRRDRETRRERRTRPAPEPTVRDPQRPVEPITVEPTSIEPSVRPTQTIPTRPMPRGDADQPKFHVYRPSSQSVEPDEDA